VPGGTTQRFDVAGNPATPTGTPAAELVGQEVEALDGVVELLASRGQLAAEAVAQVQI
jgi:hypothetical protein